MKPLNSHSRNRSSRLSAVVQVGGICVLLLVLLSLADFCFLSRATIQAADDGYLPAPAIHRMNPTPVYSPTPDLSNSRFFHPFFSWSVLSNLQPVPTPTETIPPCQPYTVQPGDTLGVIAARFGVTVAELAELNNLADINNISVGQVLVLPCPQALPTAVATSVPTEQPEPVPAFLITPTLQLSRTSEAWALDVYKFGSGPQRVALIGGIHGGYEWNSILLAYQAIDYFAVHPEEIPVSVTLFLIPSANPTGQVRIIGHTGRFQPEEVTGDTKPGRFNARNVDLNRNWDCNWQPVGLWGRQEVDAGSAPFSESENQLLRDFLVDPPMNAVVFWHSALPGVIPGGCNQPFPAARHLAQVYADATAYPLLDSFTNYQVTGDSTDWLATKGIPAITVELSNHQTTEWPANLRGILSVLRFAATPSTPESP